MFRRLFARWTHVPPEQARMALPEDVYAALKEGQDECVKALLTRASPVVRQAAFWQALAERRYALAHTLRPKPRQIKAKHAEWALSTYVSAGHAEAVAMVAPWCSVLKNLPLAYLRCAMRKGHARVLDVLLNHVPSEGLGMGLMLEIEEAIQAGGRANELVQVLAARAAIDREEECRAAFRAAVCGNTPLLHWLLARQIPSDLAYSLAQLNYHPDGPHILKTVLQQERVSAAQVFAHWIKAPKGPKEHPDRALAYADALLFAVPEAHFLQPAAQAYIRKMRPPEAWQRLQAWHAQQDLRATLTAAPSGPTGRSRI